jgi:hypothetical protein
MRLFARERGIWLFRVRCARTILGTYVKRQNRRLERVGWVVMRGCVSQDVALF